MVKNTPYDFIKAIRKIALIFIALYGIFSYGFKILPRIGFPILIISYGVLLFFSAIIFKRTVGIFGAEAGEKSYLAFAFRDLIVYSLIGFLFLLEFIFK